MASLESFTITAAAATATTDSYIQAHLPQRRPFSIIASASSSPSSTSSYSSSSSSAAAAAPVSSSRGRPSLFRSSFLSSLNTLTQTRVHGKGTINSKSCYYTTRKQYHLKATSSSSSSSSSLIGEEPEWSEDDHIVLGLAHCFEQEPEGGRVRDLFLIEPIGASSLECMENGGATSYLHVTTTTLGQSLQRDLSALPAEFSKGKFCENFEFRLKCTARTWKRDHAVKNLMRLAPAPGFIRSDFNFSLADKRIVNKVYHVTDADNIKQDMSIDVYGRKQDDGNDSSASQDEASAQVASLYNA